MACPLYGWLPGWRAEESLNDGDLRRARGRRTVRSFAARHSSCSAISVHRKPNNAAKGVAVVHPGDGYKVVLAT